MSELVRARTSSGPTRRHASGNSESTELVRQRRRRRLAEVVTTGDPAEANQRITRTHHELSGLLDGALGPDAGPNFHTWAVWGSREAGKTIARKDIAGLTAWMALIGAASGLLLGLLGGLPPGLVAVVTAIPFAGLTHVYLRRASHHISHGNRIVLEEIGGATVDFLAALERGDDPDAVRFIGGLEPGPTERGGQDLLRRAFAAYVRARQEPDRSRRHQLVFAANCFAVKHEHIRLQRDIESSMPWALRRLITARLLDFWVGDEHLHVSRDLTAFDGACYPVTLRELTVADAIDAVVDLARPGPREEPLKGSGAVDWSVFDLRMNYIVDLFRSRHLSPQVFAVPYMDSVPADA